MRHVWVLLILASCRISACSAAAEPCDPRNANCPKGYSCALAEICTRRCEQTSDCWVRVEDGCRYPGYLPGQKTPDGGVFSDQESADGFCPETKAIECISGYCQQPECADGGCDYDLYGPSPYKGTPPRELD
ncbi:MAG: hypothetical protein QM817_09075 [Archangium sp.]